MKLRKVAEILDAKALWDVNLEQEVLTACASDMMSDALAFVKEQGMLLTGLVNAQSVRTAEMLDMHCICFVRGKVPEDHVVELAKEKGIALLSSKLRMFTACGRLYEAGLRGTFEDAE